MSYSFMGDIRPNLESSGLRLINYNLQTASNEFTRKDYLKYYQDISSATASRDLKNGVQKKDIEKFGDKKTSRYRKK